MRAGHSSCTAGALQQPHHQLAACGPAAICAAVRTEIQDEDSCTWNGSVSQRPSPQNLDGAGEGMVSGTTCALDSPQRQDQVIQDTGMSEITWCAPQVPTKKDNNCEALRMLTRRFSTLHRAGRRHNGMSQRDSQNTGHLVSSCEQQLHAATQPFWAGANVSQQVLLFQCICCTSSVRSPQAHPLHQLQQFQLTELVFCVRSNLVSHVTGSCYQTAKTSTGGG